MTAIADEVWKIHICSRDAAKAEEVAASLAYLLTGVIANGFEEHLNQILQFNGEQIAATLQNSRNQSLESIARGLKQT